MMPMLFQDISQGQDAMSSLLFVRVLLGHVGHSGCFLAWFEVNVYDRLQMGIVNKCC